MANHSPKPDNYVGKKTFSEALAGDELKREGGPQEQPTAEKQALEGAAEVPTPDAEGDTAKANPARGNGSKK